MPYFLFISSMIVFSFGAAMLIMAVKLYAAAIQPVSSAQKVQETQEVQRAPAPLPTLDEYFKTWYDSRVGTIAPSTAYSNEKCYAVISRFLGSLRLNELTPAAVTAFQQQLLTSTILRGGVDTGRHYSVRTIKEEMALLSSMLKSAAQAGLIDKNPCPSVKPARDASAASIRDGAHRALTDREVKTFFAEASGSWYCPMFVFLLQTGCRAGEAAALTWDDVDLKRRTVYIHRTLEQVGNGKWEIADSPKTASGVRRIRLSDEAIDALKRQREQNAGTARRYPDAPAVVGKRIFTSTRGDYVSRNNINTAIATIVRRVSRGGGKLDRFSSHAFRHSFATKCVEQGMTPEVLRGILGHSDIRMTMGTYYHLSQERMNRALAKVKIPAAA